jgi:hypothetical protein
MIKIPELDIEVEDISDFNDRASEILEEFCMELDKQPGMSRPAWTHSYMKPALLTYG